MLVVIFLSCHCSLLCSPSFLIILSAIYQTKKSERKKKLNLSFLCIMAYVKVFWGKMFCVFSFRAVKKELVVCRNYSIFSFTVVWFLLILKKVFSSLLSWEKPKSMHFSGSCKRDVCLFDNTSKSVTGWDLKVQKMQAFLFLQLIVLMHFVPVEFFILEIKGYNKKS